MSLSDYYKIVCKIWPEIKPRAARGYDVPEYTEIKTLLDETFDLNTVSKLPACDYLVYLRHHGFPSPLLDWSRSPDVAAYFAYQRIPEGAKSVSVFVFCELPEGCKHYLNLQSRVMGLAADCDAHSRHLSQRAQYTMCVVPEATSWNLVPHDDVFGRQLGGQDVLQQFDLPAEERMKVLGILARRGINSFTLFGSEDSLIEELGRREFTA